MSRGRTGEKRQGHSVQNPSGSWVVVVDQEPLRERAATDCAQALANLKRAREGWHHFERKDKPAFIRWRAREFGALLSMAREVEEQIRDLHTLIHAVELEMRCGFQDAFAAYQTVMARRGNSTTSKTPPPSAKTRDPRRLLSDFEKEALFQEWVRRSLGTHPDKMDDTVYASSFEAFKAHMFRAVPDEPKPNEQKSASFRPPTADEEDAEPEEKEAADYRVKELYRRLVRRLHPDLRADGSTAVSALWHEAQEAYAAHDIARMEILLALSDIESQQTDRQTLAQMRSVFTELQRALRALEKSLLEAKGEEAWDFARLGPSPDLRLRVERQLKIDLASRTQRLDLLKRTVTEWAAGPIANRQVQFA
jgi:hypothetical protein